MIQNNRIIVSDNAVLTDRTVALNDMRSQTVALTNGNPIKLYIGADWRFNHRYILVGTANTQDATVSVDLWDGGEWVPAVDVLDQTSSSGKALAQSGIISWSIDKNEGWEREASTEDVTDLTGFKIYDKFWARITLSDEPTGSCVLRYIGQKFSTDSDLAIQYPELLRADLLQQFDPNNLSKSDWNEQHLSAAEIIVSDLKKNDTIISDSQILDWEALKHASIHMVASIIFANLGKDYTEDLNAAQSRYSDRIKRLNTFNVDTDLDGRQDVSERAPFIGIVRR